MSASNEESLKYQVYKSSNLERSRIQYLSSPRFVESWRLIICLSCFCSAFVADEVAYEGICCLSGRKASAGIASSSELGIIDGEGVNVGVSMGVGSGVGSA